MAKVGVFDSGVGGLSVLSALVDRKVSSEFFYFGDTARVPYGSKAKESIVAYSLEAIDYFSSVGVDVLIVACNSVSACAIKEMREKARFPVVGVVEAGVESVVKFSSTFQDRILFIGTKATVDSDAYGKKLRALGFESVQSLATPLLVNLVEEEVTDGRLIGSALEYYFEGVEEPDVMVLGCTHFPMLQSQIQSFFPGAAMVHCGYAIVDWLYAHDFVLQREVGDISVNVFATDSPGRVVEYAKKWMVGKGEFVEFRC